MTAITSFIEPVALKNALARVGALQDRIGFFTRDSNTEDAAARNLANGKPAFGWTCTYSNARGGTFVAEVNRFASIEAAQDDLSDHFKRNGADVRDERWLNLLLPLNRAAVMDLMRAYQNVGTFRSPDELARRTERLEASAPAHVLMGAEV